MMDRVAFRAVISLFAVLLGVMPASGQVIDPPAPVTFQAVTLSFDVGEAFTELGGVNPFLDRRLDVTVTSPSGLARTVPGFYDGDGAGGGDGRVWRARFIPSEPGTWTWSASFRAGAGVNISLDAAAGVPAGPDGASGAIAVGPPDPAAPGLLARGKLRYAGGHHLRFDDGSFFVKGGADSPENWLGYRGFDNTRDGGAGPNTPDGLHAFPTHVADWNPGDPDWDSPDTPEPNDGRAIIGALNYLASTGVNAIYFLPMNIGGDGKDSWPFASPAINPSGSPANDNLRYDISKLAQWELVFAHAQRLGLTLQVVLTEAEAPNKRELDGYDAAGSPIQPELGVERKLFYREMAARIGHHQAVVWNISEEYNLSLNLGVDRVLEFAAYLKAVDGNASPVTVHNAGNPSNTATGPWSGFIGRPEIDLTSLQWAGRTTGLGDVIESYRLATAAAGRPIPVMFDEYGSPTRDFGGDFETFRKRAIWPVLMSGGGAEHFINNRDQSLEDFREFDQMWRETGHAVRFFEAFLPFWEMTPDDTLVSGATTAFDGVQVLAKPGEVYAIYYPDASARGTLDLSDAATAELSWYDPRSGVLTPAGPLAPSPATPIPAPPAAPALDWVALVTAAPVDPDGRFTLTVVGGAGGGRYEPGEVVAIVAQPPAGLAFERWTGFPVADPLAPATTLVMPGSDASVTAEFTDLPSDLRILGFTLVDAGTDADLATVADGAVLALDELPGSPDVGALTMRADAAGDPGSVELLRGGVRVAVENVPPFSFSGDSGGNYNPLSPPFALGPNTVGALPYAGANAGGTPGEGLSATFTLVATRCVPDIVADGVLDLFDILAYFTRFGDGDARADLGGPSGTPDGTLDLFDILRYFELFAAGCG